MFLAIALALLTIVGPRLAFEEDYKGPPIRLYLFVTPTEGGFVDDAFKARAEAFNEIRKKLSDSKWVQLVEAREQAQIQVEVLGRTKEFTGNRSLWLSTMAEKVYVVRAKLTVGEYSTELSGSVNSSMKREAARDVAKAIEKWVKENGAKLAIRVRQQ